MINHVKAIAINACSAINAIADTRMIKWQYQTAKPLSEMPNMRYGNATKM